MVECEQASCGGWAYTCMYHVSLQCLRVGERWELLCVCWVKTLFFMKEYLAKLEVIRKQNYLDRKRVQQRIAVKQVSKIRWVW